MSVAPFAGVVALDNFKSPTAGTDGIQGQVPKPLAGQQNYVLTASGWSPTIVGEGTVTSVDTSGTVNGLTLTGGPITTTGTITLGGTLDLSSPPTIGNTTPNTGAFTTLSASSTVSGTGFSTYLASPPAIGGTTPSTGSFTTLIGGGGSANYGQLTGGATTKTVQFQTLGSDTNVSLAVQSKGTGAIDLAAGSSGVNISNGGTVTAITRTASGGPGYTTVPSVTLSAPTTAGGVQATASATMFAGSATVSAGGSGYLVGDVLTVSGGTFSVAIQLTVATLSGSAVATVTITNAGSYTALPTNPASTTGGTGSGATFTLGWGVNTIVVGTAGSGYVEQPTVTFSSGSASAYATVGGGTRIQSLGSTLDLYGPGGIIFRAADTAQANVNWVEVTGSSGNVGISSNGSGSPALAFKSKSGSANSFTFGTNNSATNIQFQIANTASAVNYVQVTGAATTGQPTILATGSDAAVGLTFNTKSVGTTRIQSNSISIVRFTGTASAVNYIDITHSITGNAPVISAQSISDSNVDLKLSTLGTGVLPRYRDWETNNRNTIQIGRAHA